MVVQALIDWRSAVIVVKIYYRTGDMVDSQKKIKRRPGSLLVWRHDGHLPFSLFLLRQDNLLDPSALKGWAAG